MGHPVVVTCRLIRIPIFQVDDPSRRVADGKEEDVFSLIGPKRVDVPWKMLEKDGFIATAHCLEIRVPQPTDERMEYAVADQRQRFRIASENSLKLAVVDELLVYLAPLLIGQGRGMSNLGPLSNLQEALALDFHEVTPIGPDLRLLARIRR